jgi:DNA-directed RNA polymerase subunit RPC12/RpoP
MEKLNENSINLLLKYFNENKSYEEIALLLNRTYSSIKNKLNKLGYKFRDVNPAIISYKCENCGNEFNDKTSVERRFCSNSCAAKINNKLRHKISDKKCLNCNKILHSHQNKYCSNNCCTEYHWKQTITKIENGDTSFNERIYKKYLIHKHGNKCMKCGWNEINPVTKLVPIQLEHKDGNSDNHNLNNLELLCPNCHSLTPTFGALNKGNGRDALKKKKLIFKEIKCDNTWQRSTPSH